MRKLKKYLVLLVVFLSVLSPCLSEDYYEITESELTTLENKLKEQESLILQQEKMLNNLKITLELNDKMLMNVQESWKVFEKEELKKKIEIGAWSTLTGILLGGIVASLIIYK